MNGNGMGTVTLYNEIHTHYKIHKTIIHGSYKTKQNSTDIWLLLYCVKQKLIVLVLKE